MDTAKAVEIIEKAIELEREGHHFYSAEAEKSEHESVRKIFLDIAEEEKKHEKILRTEYNYLSQSGLFRHIEDLDQHSEFRDYVLSDDLIQEIDAAGHEASAISSAIGLERRTIEFYTQRAADTDDPQERELYENLAEWEEDHVKYLSELNRRILQEKFFDGAE
ncbi:MAG: ferritin-like domain-containing protein [Spirochaetaceae bacterium]